VFNFVLAEVTPIGFATIGSRYYIVFAVINAVIVPSVYFFFPETKGRSLEEIDAIFAQSNNILDPPRVARRMQNTIRADHLAGQRDSESGAETNEYIKEEIKS